MVSLDLRSLREAGGHPLYFLQEANPVSLATEVCTFHPAASHQGVSQVCAWLCWHFTTDWHCLRMKRFFCLPLWSDRQQLHVQPHPSAYAAEEFLMKMLIFKKIIYTFLPFIFGGSFGGRWSWGMTITRDPKGPIWKNPMKVPCRYLYPSSEL